MSFWQDLKANKITEKTKKRFARFSQGIFEKEPITFSLRGKKLTIKCGVFDEQELIEIISKLSDKAKVKGTFITKATLPFPSTYDKKRKANVYNIDDEIDLNELVKVHGFFTGEIQFDKGNLKTKKTLPKINKQDPNFAKLTLNFDENVEKVIKEVYALGLDYIDKGEIKYTIYIDKIELPTEITEDVREKAIREGKIVREINLGNAKREELRFRI